MSRMEMVVPKLLELTRRGELSWARAPVPDELKRKRRNVDAVYVASYSGWKVAVFEEGYEDYSDEFDRVFWNVRASVAILNGADLIEYEFPYEPAAHELLEVAKYQASNVKKFLDVLLSGEGSKK